MSRADLVAAIQRGHVLIVAGAGVAIAASGGRQTASWTGLLRDGLTKLQQLQKDDPWAQGEIDRLSVPNDAMALSYVAEQLRERMSLYRNEQFFERWLADAVADVDASYGKHNGSLVLLDALMVLGGRIATTNYDHSLERHCGFVPITMDQEHEVSSFIRNDMNAVLHLHGVPEKPQSIVLGRQSYRVYVGNAVATEFQRALSTIYSCLFVGFGQGLQDLNFSPWFKWIRKTLAGSSIKHHILLSDEQAAAWQESNRDAVEALAYGSQHAQLPEFLRNLRQQADNLRSIPGPTRAAQPPEVQAQLLDGKIRGKLDGIEDVAESFHDYIRSRLIENRLHYYAVKVRIKSYTSVWNKVQDLHGMDPTANIIDCVDKVRDIIGIRVVTLYRLDLRHVVRQVASWFSCPKYKVVAPFDAAIEEVRVFGNDAPFDVEQNPYEIVTGLKDHFRALEVRVLPSARKVATSYSAFHLLCSYSGRNGSREMFEIQLRSALEDIWSEMEHPLRYKPIDRNRPRASRDAHELQLARYHLLSLKSLIDGAAQYADNIRTQIEHLQPITPRTLGTYTLSKTDRLRALLPASPQSQHFLQRFTACFEEQTQLIENVADPNLPMHDTEDRARAGLALIRLASEFAALLTDAAKIPFKSVVDRQEAVLLVQMEQALCLLEGAARQGDRSEQEANLKAALTIYTSIRLQVETQSLEGWAEPYKHIVCYRLARLYYRLKLISDAVDVCSKAYERICAISVGGEVSNGVRIQTEIANYLIFLLQDKAEDLTLKAAELMDPNYHADERRELYRRMTAISLESLTKIDEQSDDFCNTAIFGAAECSALGTPVWQQGVGTYARIKELWDRFCEHDFDNDADRLHTAFRFADVVVNDQAFAAKCANQLVDLVATLPEPDKYQRRDSEQAKAWLARQVRRMARPVTVVTEGEMRAAPETHSDVVRKLAPGAVLYPMSESSGEWVRVADEAGHAGWVLATLISN